MSITNKNNTTMRAAVITGPGEARIERVPIPEPGPGQLRVRLAGSGVCASNVPVWEGRPWFSYPLAPGAPGHEGWGVVDAVGPGTSPTLIDRQVVMISGGAFAEYDVADADSVIPIPGSLAHRDLPGEALGCAVNVVQRSHVRNGHRVAVVGAGFLGALVIQLIASAGARIIAVSRRSSSRALARKMGAEITVALDDAESAVNGFTHGDGCDRVIEVTGHADALAIASRLVRIRGRLVIAGYHQDGARSVDMQLWNWRGIDVINAHERDPIVCAEGARAALEATERGAMTPFPLLTHRFDLDHVSEAMDAAASRPRGFVKAVICM